MYKWIVGLLVSFGTWLVERLAKYFVGIGAFGVAYVGVNALVDRVVGDMVASIGGVADDAYQVMMMAGFGEVLNVLLSALAFSLALSVSQGVVK